MQFKIFAALLGTGGVLWGLFCLYFILEGNTALALMLFGPGYVITAGYVLRAIFDLPNRTRQLIWGISLIIQIPWLLWGVYALHHDGIRSYAFDLITIYWWSFAVTVSCYGLFCDRNMGAQK